LDKNKELALQRQADRLVKSGQTPTLTELCAAVLEARMKYANQIRRARREAREKVVSRKSNLGDNMTDTFFTKSGSSPGGFSEPDFVCEYHIWLFLLRPVSAAAFDWIESHLPDDRLTFGNATVIEPRYVWNILLGIQESGLSVVPR
jgi:hypothetical protein